MAYDFGQALSGFGAAMTGQTQQFNEGLRRQQAMEYDMAENEERKALMSQEREGVMLQQRAKAAVKDAILGQDLVNSGDYRGVVDLATSRRQSNAQLGVTNNEDTDRIMDLAALSSQGDKKAQDLLKSEFDRMVKFGLSNFPELAPKEEEAYTLAKGAKRFKGGELVAENIDEQAQFELPGSPLTKKEIQSQTNTLRKDVQNVTATFRKTEEAYKKVETAGKAETAAGDMSLIFAIMKILDPGSAVKEGEYANARNAGGWATKTMTLYNNAKDGTLLGEEQRKDFINQANNLYSAQRQATDNQISNILQYADQDGIPRERVLGRERLKDLQARMESKAAEPAQPASSKYQIEVL